MEKVLLPLGVRFAGRVVVGAQNSVAKVHDRIGKPRARSLCDLHKVELGSLARKKHRGGVVGSCNGSHAHNFSLTASGVLSTMGPVWLGLNPKV
ncbi:hypothetical protein C4D60_Mb03t12200 [Musa balbisiana]|uniref:Uncharacterized protein n=1 Tax=Musa balbisiana TaxID=52838 RepID=A0A4S8J9F3_MUSBA|nr:hypothetical protein C4D60_Mb03t12200 [Musa balbisiana]